jgi:hypothetical protein
VHCALLWLAIRELRQAGLGPGLTALALTVTILAVSVLGRQIENQRTAILRGYEERGATTFVAELVGVTESEIEELVSAVRGLEGITSAEAPYRGSDFGLTADTSFLVFQNEKQQEYLGATTTVLGVTDKFDPSRDYYENIGPSTPWDRKTPLGIPLLVTSGTARAPAAGEVLIPTVVAEYVGIRADTRANVELIHHRNLGQPIVRRYDDLRVIGTFDTLGPDEGRFAPFWRFAARGRDVLTVRRPGNGSEMRTTLPVVVSVGLLRNFMTHMKEELKARGEGLHPRDRGLLVIRATTTFDVTKAEGAVHDCSGPMAFKRIVRRAA